MKQSLCSVVSNVEVMPGVYLMWIEAPDMAAAAQPGQFITVRCGDFTLRRPFSIHQTSPLRGEEPGEGEIGVLFQVAGKGTLWLSQRKAGEKIDILGPLGKGFTVAPKSRNLLLVAGGLGIAPLVFLAQQASSRHHITLIHGAITAAPLYPFPFANNKRSAVSHLPDGVQLIPVTEDGSSGHKGKATDVLPDYSDWADQIYACGPVGMYEAMAEMSLRAEPSNLKRDTEAKTTVGEGLVPSYSLKLKKCQVSLEVRMGCGFGACYGCTINTTKGLKQICRDGPVFELGDIIWQEVRI